MTKRWILLNLVLLVVAVLLAWQLRNTIRRFDQETDLAAIKPATHLKPGERQDTDPLPLKPPRQYNPAEFASVVNQNVFSETRTNPKDEEPPAAVVEQIPELKNKPILVGVILDENQRFATIVPSGLPGPPPGPGRRRSQTIRLGDVYQGYTVVDITDDKMVLAYGSRTEIIQLGDSTRQMGKGAKTPIIASRVVNFGGGASSAPVQMAAAAPGESARPAPSTLSVFAVPTNSTAGRQIGRGGIIGTNPAAILPPGTAIGQSNIRGVDTQTGARVVNTPAGPLTIYPP